jgi:hypothetical protein
MSEAMGGGVTVTGMAMFCEGDAVVNELNRVFLHPGTPEYRLAQSQKHLFDEIANGRRKGRWKMLLDAYKACGVAVSPNWGDYLSTLGAWNIIEIAKARYEGLSGPGNGTPMLTQTHDPGSDHKVIIRKKGGSIEIDSPFEADPECKA